MRTVIFKGEDVVDIDNPDLSAFTVSEGIVLKQGVVPVDDVEKFAYEDSDYEKVLICTPINDAESVERRILELKGRLRDTDYIAAKTVDSLLSCESPDDVYGTMLSIRKEYNSVLQERAGWRTEINNLQAIASGTKEL